MNDPCVRARSYAQELRPYTHSNRNLWFCLVCFSIYMMCATDEIRWHIFTRLEMHTLFAMVIFPIKGMVWLKKTTNEKKHLQVVNQLAFSWFFFGWTHSERFCRKCVLCYYFCSLFLTRTLFFKEKHIQFYCFSIIRMVAIRQLPANESYFIVHKRSTLPMFKHKASTCNAKRERRGGGGGGWCHS